jgi:hypothetical protein
MKLFICGLALMTLVAIGPVWAGAQCTYVYPQGFNVTNYKLVKTKKSVKVRRVEGCPNGIFGETWRVCELRYRT